jgi:hypothetical protein
MAIGENAALMWVRDIVQHIAANYVKISFMCVSMYEYLSHTVHRILLFQSEFYLCRSLLFLPLFDVQYSRFH